MSKNVKKWIKLWVLAIPIVALTLAGCGNNTGTDSLGGLLGSIGSGATATNGVAVDPYISGAVFVEISADGGAIRQQSTPSDENGRFTFPQPLTPGSTIMMKAGASGTHNGVPYTGILARKVDGVGSLVVSPLTTLEADGMTADQVITLLGQAGLPGLRSADITANPMAGLTGLQTVNTGDMARLQASMAVNSFLQVMGNYQATPDQINANLDKLTGMVSAVKEVVSKDAFGGVVADNQSALNLVDGQMTTTPYIDSAVQIMQAVTDQVKADPTLDPVQVASDLLPQASTLSLDYYVKQGRGQQKIEDAVANGTLPNIKQDQVPFLDTSSGSTSDTSSGSTSDTTSGTSGSTTDQTSGTSGSTTTTQPTTIDGATLYANDCAGCHGALASSSVAGATASNIQNAINTVGAMSSFSSLSSDQIQALADALASSTSTTPTSGTSGSTTDTSSGSGSTTTSNPPATIDGATLYTNDCASCHGALSSSSVSGATATQIQNAINSVGAMSSFSSLSSDEIQAIANALAPASSTTSPTSGTSGDPTGTSSGSGTTSTIPSGTKLAAFPGAQGFGTQTPAGRGGKIIEVTNLNDSGAGSLRAALSASGPRIVVFNVSGTISLKGMITISNPNVSIYGQTAPAPGIQLTGGGLNIETHDVLVQHLVIRPGIDDPSASGKDDAITINFSSGYNVVIDHVSAEWAPDEEISTWIGAHDITISHCLISCALGEQHGMLVGDSVHNIFVYGNLFVNNGDRNPAVKGDTYIVAANNFSYDPGGWEHTYFSDNGYSDHDGDGYSGPIKAAFVYNAYLDGPSSTKISAGLAIANVHPDSQIYQAHNIRNGSTNGVASGSFASSSPIPLSSYTFETNVDNVESEALANAGSRPAFRDSFDASLIQDVKTGTGSVLTYQPAFPTYKSTTRDFAQFIPANPNGDDSGDGFTNIEEVAYQMALQVEGK